MAGPLSCPATLNGLPNSISDATGSIARYFVNQFTSSTGVCQAACDVTMPLCSTGFDVVNVGIQQCAATGTIVGGNAGINTVTPAFKSCNCASVSPATPFRNCRFGPY
jgi:hypothetical protein